MKPAIIRTARGFELREGSIAISVTHEEAIELSAELREILDEARPRPSTAYVPLADRGLGTPCPKPPADIRAEIARKLGRREAGPTE